MSRQTKQTNIPKRRSQLRRLSLEVLECRELLAGFTVMTAQDNGDDTNPTAGSLRAAIIAADNDNSVGGYAIMFAIPGTGPQPIALKSPLPTITRSVLIDGALKSGSSVTPGVVLDGSGAGAGANGLTFSGGESTVRGLAIVGNTATAAGGGGNAIVVEGTAGGMTIEGNYIGIGADGTTADANTNGIVITTPNNTIGGTIAAARNVVSGNTDSGILIGGPGATGNVVSGNYIGTDASGSDAVGNQFGVVLEASFNLIGGTTAAAANVISGNTGPNGQNGVGVLFEGAAMNDTVAGNLIGTDATGLKAVPNVYGVYFGTPGGSTTDNVQMDAVGGPSAGAGNLISGNDIGITGNTTTTLIAGNKIGLDATGTTALPNSYGIFLGATASTIGGATASARNVISGAYVIPSTPPNPPFGGTGLDLTGDGDLVQGNYIGLTTAGVGASGTGNVVGLALHTSNTTVAGNVISGNTGDAITLDGLTVDPMRGDRELVGNVIQGNVIGLDAGGASLPNGGNGINLTIAAPSTTPTTPLALNDSIGGTAAGAGNIITGSGGAGFVVHDNYPTGITGLTIRENRISGNAKLGIDLNGTGVPIPSTLFVTAAGVINGQLSVIGVIYAAPSTSYAIDLFANGADPSGFGQGPIFLGTQTVTTDPSGFAVFDPSFTPPSTPYTSYSATATGPFGNTTEFSANYPKVLTGLQSDLSVTTSTSSSTVVVGNTVTLTETVTNNGPNAANGVLLTDSLPASLVNVQVQSSPGTVSVDGNNVATAALGTLAPGQSATVTIVGVASMQGTLVDAPGTSSTTFDPNYNNNQAIQSITVTPSVPNLNADLAISQVASPTSGTVGSNLTYVLTVTNNGPGTSTNATVNDFLPAGVTLVSVTPSPPGAAATVKGNLVTANLGTIASGATATLTLVVTPTAAGSITNAANVSGNQFDPPAPPNNSTSLTTTITAATPPTPRINLILAQSVYPSTGTVGSNQIYTMTVTNFGPDAATDVMLVDALPPNVTFVNALPSQGGFASLVNGVITENFGTIAAGASATLTLVVVPNTSGTFINVAAAFTPDVPTAPITSAYGIIPVFSGPSVTGVAGTSKNSGLVVYLDEALNSKTATNKANYKLTALGKAGKGPNKSVTISSVTYNSATHSVLIRPSKALDPTQTYQLVLIGSTKSGIADIFGRRLVNPQFTAPGANYTATFSAGALPQV